MAADTFWFPVSNGIFQHRERIGPAIWVFLWLVDHVTKENPGDGTEMDGLVLGGSAVKASTIARDIGESSRSVQAHLSQLERHGYVRRLRLGAGEACGYVIRKSKKWNRVRNVILPDTHAENCGPPQDSADPPRKTAGPRRILRSNKEGQDRDKTETNISSNSNSGVPILSDAEASDRSLFPESNPNTHERESASLREVWLYYLAATCRREKFYSFSKLRKDKGLARLRECLTITDGDHAKAVELMKLAIDAMCSSDFHMGHDPAAKGKRYIEWERHLFSTREKLEWWWARNDGN